MRRWWCADKPIAALGLDSLVAVEVRSWVARETDAKVSAMELMFEWSVFCSPFSVFFFGATYCMVGYGWYRLLQFSLHIGKF